MKCCSEHYADFKKIDLGAQNLVNDRRSIVLCNEEDGFNKITKHAFEDKGEMPSSKWMAIAICVELFHCIFCASFSNCSSGKRKSEKSCISGIRRGRIVSDKRCQIL